MNDLAQRLSAASEEATHTDYEALRARVSATSRRLGRQRRALVAAGAVLAAGAVVTGAVGLVPHRHSGPVPASSPPALVYLRETGGRLAVVTVTGGRATTTDFGPVGQADQIRLVSPDGNRVALVVTSDSHNFTPGDLVIVTPGGGRRTVAHNIEWDGGAFPVWTPDSKQLMVLDDGAAAGAWVLVTVADGKVTPLPGAYWSYFAWSNNGAYRAYFSGLEIVTARADGTVVSRTPERGIAGCPEPSIGCGAVLAVSGDGRYVAVGVSYTEFKTVPPNAMRPAFVLDTHTGTTTPLPVAQSSLLKVYFPTAGGMLIQAQATGGGRTLTTIGADGTVGTAVPDPDPQDTLVGYRP